ncbi:MAG: hemolysin family protein, partial [Negativicutes bacterium]|nr:hemolysin family protein [Negativicutes bacterium]
MIALKIIAALALVLVNGFFVMAEFSLVKVRRTRLEELAASRQNRSAALAIRVTDNFGSYLAAAQLGITLASLGLGWLGEPAIAAVLRSLFGSYFAGDGLLLHTASIVIAFFLITMFHVTLGEQVPKILAIEYAERAALVCVWPLYGFRKAGYLFIAAFDWLTRLILRGFAIRRYSDEAVHSEEEIRMILNDSQRRGMIDEVESELIDNVFEFSERLAREIMRPRQEMVCLFIDQDYQTNIRIIQESNHTRYPLCQGDKDNVVGMVHIRDIMQAALQRKGDVDLRALRRDVLMVPESIPVSKLLQEMRSQHIHLAVLEDEYGLSLIHI